MGEHDGPPVCESCDQYIENPVNVVEDPDGQPMHPDCLTREIDQLRAEQAAVRSGRGDMERW